MIPDRDAIVRTTKRICVFLCAGRDVLADFGPQPVMKTARRMFRLAADMEARYGGLEALRTEIAPVGDDILYRSYAGRLLLSPDDAAVAVRPGKSDAMKFASKRNNGAIDEGHRLG